ncbi:MAG TPA: hypothetical protein VKZ54_07935 [Membranihabitans sp.]|nr:hypothetical protein [Membranihabitans sp.]
MVLFLLTGCEREHVPWIESSENSTQTILTEEFELISIETQLEGSSTRNKRDTLDVIKLNIRKKNSSQKFTLTLLPTIAFADRWTTVEQKSEAYLLRRFTGAILKDRDHRFGGIYYDGKQEEGSYSLIDLRDAPEDCFEVTVINVVTIDWFLVDGNGNITSYLGQTTEYQSGDDRVCAPPGSTEVYRDQGTNTRTVAHIPAWKVVSFLDENDHLLNSKDENFIEDNTWIIPYLEEFIEECGGKDPGRPDLGIIGNLIRTFLPSNEEKLFFERYWEGLGDWNISTTMFNDIKAMINSYQDKWQNATSTTFNGQTVTKYTFYAPPESKYELALGQFTFYVNSNGEVIGIYDEYNFEWHQGFQIYGPGTTPTVTLLSNSLTGCTDRGFINEWKTRAVSAAGLFSGAQDYNIFYP